MAKPPLKFPLALELLLLSVLPLVITSVITSLLFVKVTNTSIERTVEQLATTTTEKLDIEIVNLLLPFSNKVQELNALARINHDPRLLSIAVQAFGREEIGNFSIYYATEVSRFEEGGIFVNSDDWVPDPDWTPNSRPWYQLAKAKAMEKDASVSFSEPYIDSRTGEVCVTISYAVHDTAGNIVGVTGADLLLKDVATLVGEYKVSPNGTMALVDSTGVYVVHTDKSKMMSASFFAEYGVDRSMIQFQGTGISRSGTQVFIKNQRYFSLSPVEGTPWFVVAEGPVSDFSSTMQRGLGLVIIIIVTQAVIIMVVAWLFSRLISRTFSEMVAHCDDFSKGNFTATFEEYAIKEADSLARGFEAFSQNIRMLVGKIFNSASSVSEMSKSLSHASESIKTSVGDTVSAISQIDGTSSHQTNAVQQVDDAVNEIVGEAQELSKEIDSQNQIISYSSASIEEIVQSMDSVHKHINEAAEHVEELVKLASDNKNAVSLATQNIVNVRKESASLQEMNNVISSVAAQTNLLAMNAAIEAAHAGAAGKGFAVVADEIRKLAETAAKQANSSSTYLRAIQEKIDGIAESAVSIDKSFTGTIQRINDISQVVTQLEQSTAEQEMLSGQVLQALNDIQSSTHNITTNVNGITASTSQTSQLCHKLRSLNEDVNAGISVCKKAATQMQNASMTINVVANSTKISVSDLLEAVSSFHVERRKNVGDRRKSKGATPAEGERRRAADRRKEHVSFTPPTLS